MVKKNASQLVLFLMLIDSLTLAFNIQPAGATVPTYTIKADGSIDPPTALILRSGDVYTFTSDISGSIIVKRDNVVVNGAGHTLQGTGEEIGIDLSLRTNVTIQNMKIRTFYYAVYLSSSSHVTISGTNITDSTDGILVSDSSNNCVCENNIAGNAYEGIYILTSSNNTISENNITVNTGDGVYLWGSSNNTIVGNNISNNWWGVASYYSSNNRIFHNNFINNPSQASSESSVDIWDGGYPSGGNYWSDYTGIDEKSGPNQDLLGSDGIGDTPYGIDENNQDRYPLMKTHDIGIQNVTTSKTVVGQGYKVGINAKITDYGVNSETFNVTVYVNTTSIATQTVTLRSISSTTLTFTWDSSGFAKGNYTIWAYAWPVQGETHTADNTFTDGWVIVSMVGDINGPNGWPDGKVDMIYDIRSVAKLFGVAPPDPKYNPNYDINGDGQIDMINDIRTVAKQFGKTDP
jgi:parallel beta-helix repeat protein